MLHIFLYKKQELEPYIGPQRWTLNMSRTAVVILLKEEDVRINLVNNLDSLIFPF